MNRRRVRAVLHKELREYRRNRSIVGGMAILPMVFLIQPLVATFGVQAAAAGELAHRHELLYLLGIPALAPATLAAHAIAGERRQGTLEPLLGTPIRREELVLAKALAVLLPSVAIAYAVFGVFLACVAAFAHAGVAAALIRGSDVLAQLVFTPLIAAWSVWIGLAISARASDLRVAQQLSVLASLPSVAVTTLIALDVIHATLGLAAGLAAALLAGDRAGRRIVSALFDRERLIAGAG